MSSLSSLPLFSAQPTLGSAPPVSPQTVTITSDYTLSSDLDIAGSPGFKVIVRDGVAIDIHLDADVTVTGDGGKVLGLVTTDSAYGGATIDVTGTFTATGAGQDAIVAAFNLRGLNDALTTHSTVQATSDLGDAYGVYLTGGGADVNLFGGVQVTAAGQACGVFGDSGSVTTNHTSIQTTAQQASVGFLTTAGGSAEFDNLGLVSAHAVKGPLTPHGVTLVAAGVAMFGGVFSNTGVIQASAHGAAVGVELISMTSAINGFGGRITATASGADAIAMGVLMGNGFGSSVAFVNQGLVRADIAISAIGPAVDGHGGTELAGPDQVHNFGKIVGDIMLGKGDDVVINGDGANTGLIKGDVDLGAQDDSFDSRHGLLIGAVSGGDGDDTLMGGRGADHLNGDGAGALTGGADVLMGFKGADVLDGGQGDDVLTGGFGADTLTGGTGADTFVYVSEGDSRFSFVDLIADLDDSSDHIDLSRLDADPSTGGDQAFHIVGAFSGAAGELTISYDSVNDLTSFSGDTDGDGNADVVITAAGDHTGFTGLVL